MIDAHRIPPARITRAYDLRSAIYDWTIARSEFRYHLAALEKIVWQPAMKILEVATGPGRVLAWMAGRVDDKSKLFGLDLSQRMLDRTQRRLDRIGFANHELLPGDCRCLPWPDNHFDLLYNGYMMDLVPTADMGAILKEFRRVLKPGCPLILLNMSKGDGRAAGWLERVYEKLPASLTLHIMGNCRPVRMAGIVAAAGFGKVRRQYLAGRHPSEIITAIKEVR